MTPKKQPVEMRARNHKEKEDFWVSGCLFLMHRGSCITTAVIAWWIKRVPLAAHRSPLAASAVRSCGVSIIETLHPKCPMPDLQTMGDNESNVCWEHKQPVPAVPLIPFRSLPILTLSGIQSHIPVSPYHDSYRLPGSPRCPQVLTGSIRKRSERPRTV